MKKLRSFILNIVAIILISIVISTFFISSAIGISLKEKIEVVFNSINLTVNGEKVEADNILYKGTTYVPIRAVGEILEKEVGWDQNTNTASINDEGFISSYKNTGKRLLIKSDKNDKSVFWKNANRIQENKTVGLDLDNDGKNETITVGLNSPNSEKVILIKGKSGVNLLYFLSDKMYDVTSHLYDEGELDIGNKIQVTFVDFDDDGKDEVLLAIGDGLVTLGVSVLKIDYDSIEKAYKSGNFYDNDIEEIAFFHGQEYIRIDENKDIIVPYGGQGLFEKYVYENGKFVKLDMSS